MVEIKGVFGWALQVEYNETVLYLEHITVFGCGGTECAGSTKGLYSQMQNRVIPLNRWNLHVLAGISDKRKNITAHPGPSLSPHDSPALSLPRASQCSRHADGETL